MSYRAAVFCNPGVIRTEEKKEIDPGPTEVLIQVKACGICGTDIHVYHGSPGSAEVTPPVVLGHEMAGVVVSTGNEVANLAQGDRVTVDPNIFCGECSYCLEGNRHLCSRLTAIGVNYDGGFAERCRVPASQVYRFKGSIPYGVGALTEPLACCLHGMDRIGKVTGRNVAVIGAGPVGLIMIQLAFLSGASSVFVSETRETCRIMARSFGAQAFPPEEMLTGLRRTGEGADVVIECAGQPKAMQMAIDAGRRGADILLFSVPDVNAVLNISPFTVFYKELSIRGSFINPFTHARAVRLIESGRIDLSPLISHRYSLEKIEEAILKKDDPQSVKVLIEP